MESNRLAFFAFYPGLEDVAGAKLENASTATAYDFQLIDYAVTPDIGDQLDFVTAYATGSMADNIYSGVTLPFRHQLSRVQVNAWSGNKSCDLEIAGVRLGWVNMKGTFHFTTDDSGGYWTDIAEKDIVEYIYGKGDKIVELRKGNPSTSTAAGALSIMGNAHPGGNNAMLIPYTYPTEWDFTGDRNNTGKNFYISVLLRVIDATPTAGVEPKEKQRYPYRDLRQGINALQIPRVYLATDKATNTVTAQVYKSNNPNDNNYYSDKECKTTYSLSQSEEVKEFGWAAMPATAKWSAGYIYTYTLNYTYGVGVHDPDVKSTLPSAGDPIIDDLIGMNVDVIEWKPSPDAGEMEVPGS